MLSQSRFVLEIVNQAGFYACVLREISVPTELAIGHLRCRVTDMPPQPNSLSGRCLETRLPIPAGAELVGAVFSTVGPRGVRRRVVFEAARRHRESLRLFIPNLDGGPAEADPKTIGLFIR